MTYNMREKNADNNYNCPVVAYYPEVIAANMQQVTQCDFIYDYVGIHRQKNFPIKVHKILNQHFRVGLREVIKASNCLLYTSRDAAAAIRKKGRHNPMQPRIKILISRFRICHSPSL